MSTFHFAPTDKAVKVVNEKGDKAKDHRQVCDHREGSVYPQPDQYDIVCGVTERVIGASQDRKGSSEKARCNGDGTQNEVCRVEICQNEIERDGDDDGQDG